MGNGKGFEVVDLLVGDGNECGIIVSNVEKAVRLLFRKNLLYLA
jgi:hypothetical protein